MTTEPGSRMHAVLAYIAAHSGCSKAGAAAGLAEDLGTQAGELLRDCGRVRIGGHVYLVIIPDGQRPSDPVYLRREDGRMFAVRLRARIREVAPGEATMIDAGL